MIHVIAINATPAEAPAEIVFLPEGEHLLTPKTHPKGIAVKVPADQGAAIAAAFNRDLEKRENVKAWLDFEHSRKFPASGYPTAFRYQPGVGIMAAVEWSTSGRAAVEGRDVQYFSPEFYIDAAGIPIGLPVKGPIGGLVTEPAFRHMEKIAAAEDITEERLIAAREWMDEQVQDAAETRIEAALDTARASLPPGTSFSVVWAAAAEIDPAGFGDTDAAPAPVQRIAAAQALARAEIGSDATFVQVWAAAAEIDPAAFGDEDNRPAPVRRIAAAQSRARAVVGSDAPFSEVWAVAASLDPNAFL